MTTTKKQGRWKAGESGNPKGRPAGVSKVQELREELAKDLPKIIEKLREAAKGGDMQAARLILERVLPAMKPIEQPANLQLNSEGTMTEQGRSVLSAVALGQISPTQGSQLLGAIGNLARVSEVDELAKRLDAMEKLIQQTIGSN